MFEFRVEVVKPMKMNFFFSGELVKIHILADRMTIYRSETVIVDNKPAAKPKTTVITFIGKEVFLLLKKRFTLKKTGSMSYALTTYCESTDFIVKW